MDAALRVEGIPGPPRDQVDVAMKDRLPGDLADIDADIEPGDGHVPHKDGAPRLVDQLVNRLFLIGLEIEIAGNVAPWQDQRVERRDRCIVEHRIGERVLRDNLLLWHYAKDAGAGFAVHVILPRDRSA